MSNGRGGGAIRIVVIATSSARRRELESIIRGEPDFELAGSSGVASRIDDYASRSGADVVVADSDSIPELAEPSAAIVLFASAPDARTISLWLKAGVRSILARDSEPDEIVSAIYAAYSGNVLLSAEAAEQLAAIFSDNDSGSDEELTEEITPRETEVLRMLAEGLVNKDIAGRLGISGHTVKFHISSILAKLGASTRTEAVTLGIRRGLIPI